MSVNPQLKNARYSQNLPSGHRIEIEVWLEGSHICSRTSWTEDGVPDGQWLFKLTEIDRHAMDLLFARIKREWEPEQEASNAKAKITIPFGFYRR